MQLVMLSRDYRKMSEKKKQNEPLPPNISWPDVLEEKLTPSEDMTGKWVASTTSFERKGLRFGMDSSPTSADVKGSMQAKRRQREEKVDIRVTQQEGEHAEEQSTRKHSAGMESVSYQPTPSLLEAQRSLPGPRPGTLAGRKGHSPSSLLCWRKEERYMENKWHTHSDIKM